MLKTAAALFVFLGGFAVMVLEIIGARYLAKDFGGSFYVWISQIGVILIALALGYAIGGALADRFQRAGFLAVPLGLAGVAMILIPQFTPPLVDHIVLRHPANQEIPALWKKLDPVLGSTLVFFLPCFVLAILPPYMIRFAARRLCALDQRRRRATRSDCRNQGGDPNSESAWRRVQTARCSQSRARRRGSESPRIGRRLRDGRLRRRRRRAGSG